MSLLKTQIHQVTWAFNTLSEEDFKRSHPEDLWDDLWTNRIVYESKFRLANEMDIAGALNAIKPLQGLPNKLIMFGWLDLLQKTELPINNLNWLIISKRFLEVVEQLGFTDYRLIPIRVIDRTPFEYPADEDIFTFENDLAVQDLKYEDDLFYGFQVLSQVKLVTNDTDFFENKVVWLEDINPLELPYFFREPENPNPLLVNQAARDALEAAGIRGIRFIEPFGI